ncbi:hypothetical protein AWC38_SpisGene2007 [Stylophora pistillata]|uniref:RNA-directed DNA polymerase from mobile element jockey n=1 Tax=Stylophora pistillata TaxID=50429 RepID=A0A2B4SX03_STYPI|nr:hypothetical protein AWC38_SpisGene2007 [Stylophora pistillata]
MENGINQDFNSLIFSLKKKKTVNDANSFAGEKKYPIYPFLVLIREKDRIITDKKEIAELFNEHFVHIADNVPLREEEDYGNDFANHLSIKVIFENRGKDEPACFSFHPTSKSQVESILKEIIVRISPGHDMIPPRLVKHAASVIAEPLTNIFNHSIENCSYPENWKMDTVTPLFKKDDEFCKVNYRPVTVLPVLNNIFEKLLAEQDA